MEIQGNGNIQQALGNGTSVDTDVSANRAQKAEFQDVWKKIQSQYGEKPKEQRSAKKTLDKDDFLRIMLTQMKHQDPTKPFEADKLASEIAQIASVEQLGNVSQALKKLETQNRPLERIAMTGLIGKWATTDRSRFPHEKGQNSTLTFNLPEDAKEVKLSVMSPGGEVIWTTDMGSQPKGPNSFVWNGLDKKNFAADSGSYSIAVEALSSDGRPIKIDTRQKSKIIGVGFEGSEPVFIVGDAKTQAKINMSQIALFEDDLGDNASKAIEQSAEAVKAMQTHKPMIKTNEIFGFARGEGKAETPPPPAQNNAPLQAAAPKAAAYADSEPGFPNGLGSEPPTIRKEVNPNEN